MDLEFNNKKALVTGSTAGIGRAIAERLAAEGAQVIINGRKKPEVLQAVKEISEKSNNRNVAGVTANFSKKADVDKLIKEIPEVDILINNVGIFNQVEFEKITDEKWMEMLEVNLMSGVRLSRHYFPQMMKKDWGRIIFISSESAINIPTEMIHYGVSKTAVLGLSRGLARLSKGSNVTVNAILPGPTWSRANEKGMEKKAEKEDKDLHDVIDDFFENRRPTSLIQRFASTEEVANMVAYVASPLSSATNGAALRVDGGVVNVII